MEVENLVWFSSREHPFAVRERHCLDLECSCTDVWLTFREVDLSGKRLDEPLIFEIRVNLRNGRERRPSKRSGDVHALVREFLVRFPEQGFQALIRRRQEQRTIKRRLEEYTVSPSEMGELLRYSDVIYEEGGMASNGRHFSFFFAHDGRDYLIEDHYCPRPSCDCRRVHVEFWERIELPSRSLRVDVVQQLMAVIGLDGKLDRIEFSKDDRHAAEALSRAWIRHCGDQLAIFRERYRQVKAIGQRTTASEASVPHVAAAGEIPPREAVDALPMGVRAGRNDPCPCGSGKKFKRCCARRNRGE